MGQIYGIDLASEKFDVSFVDEQGKVKHIVVKNIRTQVVRFLDNLPEEAHLVAEHTGVYGDLLLLEANIRGITISYVSGYEIRHRMGLVRGKSDPIDASRIREYGERYYDKLQPTQFPSESLYKLRELYSLRRLLVQQRKQMKALIKGDKHRPFSSDKAVFLKEKILKEYSDKISEIETELEIIINNDAELKQTYLIAQSVPGIGPVTAIELIIKTGNFKRVSTAKKCATLAGISPWPNATGKIDKGSHVSCMGDKELKSLLFMCARSAIQCFEKMRIYKMKKYDVEKKHFFLVLNNVANKLLTILYALVKKREIYNPSYLPRDPRLKMAN